MAKMPKANGINLRKFKSADLSILKKLIHGTIRASYANFYPKEGVASEAECTIEIKAEGAEASEYWDVSDVKPTGFGGTMALSAVQTFTTPHSVSVSCRLREGEGNFSNARIIAIQTGTLHGSTPTD